MSFAPFTLALMSDLHLDFAPYEPGPVDADLIVAAGDLNESTNGSAIRWLQQRFPDQPVLFVPGNHDFFKGNVSSSIERWRHEAQGTNVHFLYNDVFWFQGVRFLGTSLWSDLASGGIVTQATLMKEVVHRISDFSHILNDDGRCWRVADMLRENRQAVEFLSRALEEEPEVPTVVVTHWGPHRGSMHPKYGDDPLNAYFINHLPHLVERTMLWLHGHTHSGRDYEAGFVDGLGRVICHPRGYPNENQGPYVPLRLRVDANTGQVQRLNG